MRFLLALILMMAPFAAFAQDAGLSGDVDLILPPTLASSDAPFYREAKVKIGETLLPVQEAALSGDKLAEYQPENKRVVVSNSASASESDKGEALLEVVTALQASTIATAAGE